MTQIPVSDRVRSSVHAAIDEFNQMQPAERQLAKDPVTVLMGADSALDSLGLVNLLITVEQQVSVDFDNPITLASEKAFSLRNSPFATVDTLTQYIASLLAGEAHA